MFGLDFANDVDHNEQLTTSAWTIAVVQGADPNPAVHLEGPPKVVVPFGSTAKTATIQRIGGLWPDVTYKVEAIVITDRGNTKSLWTHIRGVNS